MAPPSPYCLVYKELQEKVANQAENITDAAELMLTLVEQKKPIFPDEE